MDLFAKIKRKFAKAEPAIQSPLTRYGYSHSDNLPAIVPWQRSYGRRFVENDLNDMDDNDSIIARALDKIADYTCVWDNNEMGFTVELAIPEGTNATRKQKAAIELMNETAKDAKLQSIWCWDVVRDMSKKGNVFAEILFDSDGTIGEIRQFERSWEIEKNIDKKGNLKSLDPEIAMSDIKRNREAAYTQQNEGGNVIAAFWPFQIVHWKFGAGGGKVYADPMLGCVIVDWKKLRVQEEALAMSRIASPMMGYVHNVLVPAGANAEEVSAKLDEYKENMQNDSMTTHDTSNDTFNMRSRRNPSTVNRDFYIPTYYTQDGVKIEGSITPLDPSTAALDNINDIYWSVTRVLVACGVPMDYIGLKVGQRAFVDKTSEKGIEAFAKFIKRLQACHAVGINQIMDTQLLLSGYNPRDVPYRIVYPTIIPQSAEIATKIQLNKAQAASYWQNLFIPPALIGKDVLELTPAEIEMWQDYLKTAVTIAKKKSNGKDDVDNNNGADDNEK